MSHTHPSTSSNVQLILDDALKLYKKRTKNDLLRHPLATCLHSPATIPTVLQEQVQQLNRSQRINTKWLDPTMSVILTFSKALGEGVGLVFSPAKVIFIGFAVLFSTAKDVHADQYALFEIFERIGAFFQRLDVYTEVATNQGMMNRVTTILVEVLNLIGIVTKEIKQGRIKKYLVKLIGKNDVEDALKELDRLTQEEARMAAAQLDDDVDQIKRNQLRQDLRRWLSPPDPSTNHNIASNAHLEGTATWFFQGSIYHDWKSATSEPLRWIYGKRAPLFVPQSSRK